jgi:hypothetical protein
VYEEYLWTTAIMSEDDDAAMMMEESSNVGNNDTSVLPAAAAAAAASSVDENVAAETMQKRSSRQRRPKRYNDTESANVATKKARLETDAGEGDCTAGTETSTVKRKKKPKDADTDSDDMNWVCAECKEAECLMEPDADQFLLCDGVCSRVFHYPCAGLSKIPDTDEDWICKDCSLRRHQCNFCFEYGEDQVDVFRCRKDKCGLFFHESCLALNNVPVKMEQVISRNNALGAQTSPRSVDADPLHGSDNISTSMPVFTCPAHHCWTCTQEDARKKEQEEAAAKKKAKGKQKKRGSKKNASSIYQCKTEGRVYVSVIGVVVMFTDD